MRININVGQRSGRRDDAASAAAFGARSMDVELSAMPAPLVRLAPSGELVLIELQGSLEIDDPHPDGGQVLAKLEFHPGREDNPTLLISHHRLEGKIVTLAKPFALLEQKKRDVKLHRQKQHSAMQSIDVNRPTDASRSKDFPPSSPSGLLSPPHQLNDAQPLLAVQDDKDDDEDEPDSSRLRLSNDNTSFDTPHSPSLGRKRTRGENDGGVGQRRSTLDVPSSSPLPVPARMQGSEIDYSSPISASKRVRRDANALDETNQDSEEEDWTQKRDTATVLDVVCIIRKKLLFTKRPEPVVRLDLEGGEKAKKALGIL